MRDGPPGSYQDLDRADVFFVIGSNMADCHPLLFLRMMDQVKAGAKLIVVDPRRTATARSSPGSLASWSTPTRSLTRSDHFRPPSDPQTPMIMVGPGTGVAPFRSFLHRRRVLGHTAPNWLFFGERNAATDFYYRDEIQAMHAGGLITNLDLAFSRDQPEKLYVQDLMRTRGAELWSWLQDGAHLYVCGDGNLMAKEVDRAVQDIVERYGRRDRDAAKAYVRELSAAKRYQRDVY